MSVRPVVAALLAAALHGAAVPVSAQIYTWRDADGRLVLSDRPPLDPGQPMAIGARAAGDTDPLRAPRHVTAEHGTPFEDLIQRYARTHGVRADLVRAVIQVESGFDPTAVSPKGAMGLMQLMPATAAALGVANPFNPSENVRGGVQYLRRLLDRYDNDETLALAAYNAGPGAVDRYGETIPPYRETRKYVVKVNQAAGESSLDAPASPRRQIYRTVEFIDGRPVVRYSNKPPESR